GTAAATLAAERFGASAHQLDGRIARGEVLGDADDHAGLALTGHADDRDDARADLLLALVGEAAQILELDAFDRAGEQLDVADETDAVGGVGLGAPAHGQLFLRLGQLALEAFSVIEKGSHAIR